MSETITKTDLIESLHGLHDGAISKTKIAGLIEGLGGLIALRVAAGDTVILPGLGRLSTITTPERPGRNPRTGEAVTIPAGRRIKFKPAAKLKEALSHG